MCVTAVYSAVIPEEGELCAVSSAERQAEIDRCSNERVRREKYFVWRLLEYALSDAMGLDIRDVSFAKNKNGKWTSDKCFFSLSHTDGAVAVAVSKRAVGIDIEAVRRRHEGIEQRILTRTEAEELCDLSDSEAVEYIIEKWTQKESIFKTLDRAVFEPTRLETKDFSVDSRIVELGAQRYILSVCTEDVSTVKYSLNVDL